jgi:hypothetical protein
MLRWSYRSVKAMLNAVSRLRPEIVPNKFIGPIGNCAARRTHVKIAWGIMEFLKDVGLGWVNFLLAYLAPKGAGFQSPVKLSVGGHRPMMRLVSECPDKLARFHSHEALQNASETC